MPPPVSLAKIGDTEHLFGASFPTMFKARMSRQNGGAMEVDGELWFLIPFFDDTDRSTIRKTTSSIHRVTEYLRTAGTGFPEDAAAIASNQGGDYLVLRRSGSAFGKEVWLFQRKGGHLSLLRDDVADLWTDTSEIGT